MKEGYKKTIAGKIPNEWGIYKLETLVEKITDGTHKTPKYTEDGIPFLRVTDIQSSSIDFNSIKYISKEEHEELIKRCKPEFGDILYSKNGTIGIPRIIDWDFEFSIFVSLCLIKICKNCSKINTKYLEQFLKSDSCFRQIRLRAKQGTVTNLHLEEIRELMVPLPSEREQEKIADILSTVDSQIDDTDKLIEKTKVLKKGLMQRLLTKGLGHTEFKETEVGEIPVGWKFDRLNNITYLNPESLGNSTDQNLIINYIDIESVKVGKVLEYKEFQFSEAPSRARRVVAKNDVIVSTVRPNLKSIAKINFDKENLVCSTGFAVLRKKGTIDSEYLFQFVMSDIFTKQLIYKTVGSNYPAVNSTDIKETLIFVPPLEEQEKISDILSSVDMQIEEYENKKTKLEELKKGLMQQLLTGKVRVKV